MSQGTTTISIYEADSAEKHLVRHQPETAVFSMDGSPNTIPAGPATSPFWAKVSRAAKEYGLRPRKLRFRFAAGQQPAGFADCAVAEIVIFSKSVYDTATIGSTGTYLGASGTIIGRIAEDIYPAV